MNFKFVMDNLFVNTKSDWIDKIEESEFDPYIIQRCLTMNDSLRVQTRWLDKYVFSLPAKMYLSLAWSVLPKVQRAPFSEYIKKQTDEEEFDFILSKVRHHFNLSDNDFNANKDRLIKAIKKDMIGWFSFYGIPKKYWTQYKLDFNLIRQFNKNDNGPKQRGLGQWGL